MSALENLAAAKGRADARANLEQFIASRQAVGWTADDIADYRKAIDVLTGDDDAAALALFPSGTYQNAEMARRDARQFWRAAA